MPVEEEDDEEIKNLKLQAPPIGIFKELKVVEDGHKGNRIGWIIVCFIIMMVSLVVATTALIFVPSRIE